MRQAEARPEDKAPVRHSRLRCPPHGPAGGGNASRAARRMPDARHPPSWSTATVCRRRRRSETRSASSSRLRLPLPHAVGRRRCVTLRTRTLPPGPVPCRCFTTIWTTQLRPHALLYRVKERGVWIAHVKDYDPQRLGAAAVVPRHVHVRRFHYRLTGVHRERARAPPSPM
jgi:hypothetical protein